MLEANDETIHQLLNLIDQKGDDGLFDRLAALRTSEHSTTNQLRHPNPYLPLYESLDKEGEARKQSVDEFLKKYYQGMKATYWYDSHKKANGSFFGYWCFELAAFVKKINIDDASFADNIFYPRDLTGRKLLRTWEDSRFGEADRQTYKKLKAQSQGKF